MKKNKIKNTRNIYVLTAIKLKGGFFKSKKHYRRNKKIDIN